MERGERSIGTNSSSIATSNCSRRVGRIWADLKEGREEARAQTQALLALIDRFPPPAQAA